VESCEIGFLGDDFINLHNRMLLMASLDATSRTATVVDPGGVLGHMVPGTTNGAGVGGDHIVSHTMTNVKAGDVLKFYSRPSSTAATAAVPPSRAMTTPLHTGVVGRATDDRVGALARGGRQARGLPSDSAYKLLATVVVEAVAWNRGANITLPPSLQSRVMPTAPRQYTVRYAAAAAAATGGGAHHEVGDGQQEDVAAHRLVDIGAYGALVQIDSLSSFGAVVRGNHFHDSYNNAARFAASNLVFHNNVIERCSDGVHVSYDIVPG
jgi:hypothetical protein